MIQVSCGGNSMTYATISSVHESLTYQIGDITHELGCNIMSTVLSLQQTWNQIK